MGTANRKIYDDKGKPMATVYNENTVSELLISIRREIIRDLSGNSNNYETEGDIAFGVCLPKGETAILGKLKEDRKSFSLTLCRGEDTVEIAPLKENERVLCRRICSFITGIRNDLERLVEKLPAETHIDRIKVIPLDDNGDLCRATLLNKAVELLDEFKKFFLELTGFSPGRAKTNTGGNIYLGDQ